MRKDTQNFIQSSEYDIQTAKHMFDTKRYIYVIFMCHLSIEKMLKAVVAETIGQTPPKTHNLIYLIKIANIPLPQEHFEFIAKINNASIVTRYPEDLSKLTKAYPRGIAGNYLSTAKEIIRCLKKNKKLTE